MLAFLKRQGRLSANEKANKMKESIPNGIRMFFIRILGHMLPACKEITKTASRSLDEKVPLPERIRLRLHLLICAACLRYYKQLVFIQENVRGLNHSVEATDLTLSEEARNRMKRILSRE